MRDIDYGLKQATCECDICGYEEVIETTKGAKITEELKKLGWTVLKFKDEFTELCCERCYREFLG